MQVADHLPVVGAESQTGVFSLRMNISQRHALVTLSPSLYTRSTMISTSDEAVLRTCFNSAATGSAGALEDRRLAAERSVRAFQLQESEDKLA
jgi:hypothetical protein